VHSNAAYAFLLDDKARSKVESQGPVVLSELDAKALSTSKNLHTTLVVVAAFLHVKIAGDSTIYYVHLALLLLPFPFFLIGGLADARRPTAGATAKAMTTTPKQNPTSTQKVRLCKAAGRLLAGLVAWLLLHTLYIVVNGVQLV
jgi:hypothetical protein